MNKDLDFESLIKSNILPENKIGEGTYREVYRISDDYCAKVLRPTHLKDYFFFKVNYPTKAYIKYKFGIKDFNEYELNLFNNIKNRMPSDLDSSFAKIEGIVNNALIQDLVKNQDGSLSKSLLNYDSKIGNMEFWKKLQDIQEFFLDEDIFNFNVKPDNILVKNDSENLIPVIMDYKRIGPRTYPFQPQLLIRSVAQQKIIRRFSRLAEMYSY